MNDAAKKRLATVPRDQQQLRFRELGENCSLDIRNC